MHAAKKLFERLTKTEQNADILSKLEIYTFAHAMPEESLGKIHLESFVNEFDLICKVTSNNKSSGVGSTRCYLNQEGRGHLLNTHYLPAFKIGKFHTKQGVGSRLARYLSFVK